MQDNSDQFASIEDESAFHEEVIGTDDPVEETEDHSEEYESDDVDEPEESEKVKPKKDGYVEITDPKVKARVDQLSREKHEAIRKAQADARRADTLARELEELRRPAPPKEVPPPSADPITEPQEFARQQQHRDEYIRAQTKYDSDTESRNQAKQQAEVQKRSEMVNGYLANMERLKLNPGVLAKAADVCGKYGIGHDHPLTDDLLEDKDGPAIVKYLADNEEHLVEIANMRPSKALAYIEREIRAKLNVKPQSKAPPPPTKVHGTRQSGKVVDGWEIS